MKDDETSSESGDRLIIVSNREPCIHEKKTRNSYDIPTGGLVSALTPAMNSCQGLWVAWGSGKGDFKVVDEHNRIGVPPENPRYLLKRVQLSREDVEGFYHGFSNSIMWPLCHSFIEKVEFRPEYWSKYREVNQKFAQSVSSEIQDPERDYIWVHDYHLSLVPEYIREKNKKARISFFWHVPWPPWEIFGRLPWRRHILNSLLNCDLIGFQTESHLRNFLDSVRRGTKAYVDEKNRFIRTEGREVYVGEFPIGIDYEKFNCFHRNEDKINASDDLMEEFDGLKIILGVDRLDYTKGILHRLEAFQRFLEKYPEYQGRVVFLQIMNPSRWMVREYQKMKREVEEAVGRINGKFSRVDWTPIKYFYRKFSQEKLMYYYHISDVALITPLIDGMNLVAKEFLATNKDKGMLVLSEFAGAAGQLNKSILVNPYDREGVADSIKEALEMPGEEKIDRCHQMKKIVEETNINWWLNSFFGSWARVYEQENLRFG
ncbi:MAG: trehalose-6-phosphate synthase [Candidatus Altiarchaeota archaeon]|nr:trehalose-6-phosphate synthase [Candidatus Altiarchaeota archaeon]